MSDCEKCSFFCKDALTLYSLISTGMLAGENYGVNMYGLMAFDHIKDPKEKREFFKKIYKRGKRIAISSVLFSSGCLLALYSKTKRREYLCPLGLLLFEIPFTVIFIKKVDDELMDTNNELTIEETNEKLRKWKCLHWVRVTTEVIAFTAFICCVLNKKVKAN